MTEAQSTHFGTLYVVATPIGNKDDITLRAIQILKSVDLILAEDTRHSLPLLNALGIKNHLSALHAHNEHEKTKKVIEQLLQGTSIALISDAGTPLICDPGFPLVQQAKQHNIQVVPVPGACAFVTALSAAGIPCDGFQFLGFLPAKQAARRAQLELFRSAHNTISFYESTHRIISCLEDIALMLGAETEIVLAKELTKTFERISLATVHMHIEWLTNKDSHVKGEFVIIIPPKREITEANNYDELLTLLLNELPLKQAVALAIKITKAHKNELYERALMLKNR